MVFYSLTVYQTQSVLKKNHQIQRYSSVSFNEIHHIQENYSRMSLINSQTPIFFEGSDNVAMAHDTVVNLQEEGIEDVNDLEIVDKDSF